MRAFLFVRYYAFAFIKRILRISKKPIYYKRKYGLKFIPMNNKGSLRTKMTDIIELINPSELYLGIDGLFDEYTLCGRSILNSPHYGLIECSENGDIKNCEYIRREEKGCLDSRDFKYVPFKDHLAQFKRSKSEMLRNSTKPVMFYIVNGKKYIKDGKHRAALYAYYGKKLPGIEIDKSLVRTAYTKKLYNMRDDEKFSSHREILLWLYDLPQSR